MEIESGDPRDELKKIIENYKISPHSFGLISGLDEKTVLEFVDYKTELDDLSHEMIVHIVSIISLLSMGMTHVTPDGRVKAIIEDLNEKFQISKETLALYAKIDEKDIDDFMIDGDSLTFEKRYRLSVVVLFLFKIFSENRKEF